MPKTAVDVVLLPPEEVMDLAISLNSKLAERQKQEIQLDKKNMLPHITLAMGVIDQKGLNEVKRAMEDIAAHVSPLSLQIIRTATVQHNGGKPVAHAHVQETLKLKALHNLCVTKMSAFFDGDVKTSAYARRKGEQMSKSAKDYLDNFLGKHAFENYKPHITLGHGSAPKLDKKKTFTATRFALCRLGNHNTCREVLAEYLLGEGQKEKK